MTAIAISAVLILVVSEDPFLTAIVFLVSNLVVFSFLVAKMGLGKALWNFVKNLFSGW